MSSVVASFEARRSRVRAPRYSRYAAPRYLTTANAVGECAITADSPAVAAAMCTSVPASTPSAEANPARRPCDTVRVTM